MLFEKSTETNMPIQQLFLESNVTVTVYIVKCCRLYSIIVPEEPYPVQASRKTLH